MGERLQAIFGQSNELTQKARRTVAQIGADPDANLLTRITRTARTSLEALGRKQIRFQESLDQVPTMVEQLRRLEHRSCDLIKIARFLRMVGINISIESHRSTEADEIFSALAQEIRELSGTVVEVTDAFNTDSQSVQTHLMALHKEMNCKIDDFRQLTEITKGTVEQTVPAVRTIINRSVEVLARVEEDAATISKSISDIVISLQIHDNVSQRIDHIVNALADDRHCGADLPEAEGLSGACGARSAAMDANLQLQIAQLEQIVGDIEEACQVGTGAFDKILRTVESIAQKMTSFGGDHGGGTSKEIVAASSFVALKKTLQQINTMIGHGGDTLGELQRIIQSATTAVSRIEQHMAQVRNVNFDLHLKSLNAMIRSCRLGDKGKSIEVLVHEMNDVAGQSNNFLGEVDGISGTIMQAAHRLQHQCQSSQGGRTEMEDSDFSAGIKDFSTACHAFERHAEDTASLGRHLRDLIVQTADELMFLKNFAGDLVVQLEQLKRIHHQIASDGDEDHHRHLLKYKEQIAARYTMQKERDIHRQVFNQAANPDGDRSALPQMHVTVSATLEADVAVDSVEPEGRDTGEEFDDNIELF